jgi:hypothetical protein
MPVLGIIASQISGHLFTQSAFDSLATTTVGSGGTSTITFSSIPQTYTHLQIRAIARENSGAGTAINDLFVRFNSDSGANYRYHYLRGSNTTSSAGTAGSQTYAWALGAPQAGSTANVFSAGICDILDYTNTNKYTTTRSIVGTDLNTTSGIVDFISNLWLNTAAITSITITTGGNNFAQYSSFALYGIKAA